MPVTISKTVHAEVAHLMPHHPVDENRRVHGHSVSVTVKATGERMNGAVMDFAIFNAQVSTIVGLLDHRFLNDIEGLENPTLESIAEWVGKRMAITGPLETLSVIAARPHRGEAAEWTP